MEPGLLGIDRGVRDHGIASQPHGVSLPGIAESSVAQEAPPLAAERRLRSLDALRGVAVAAMILVNNPGSDADVYSPLRHAAWNGCSIADLIFPFFLFVIGVAVTFSLEARRAASRGRIAADLLRRTLLLLALGLFLNGFPLFDWSEMRFPGVLQRIALCYLFASLASLTLRPRGVAALWAVLVVGWWLALAFVPVPGARIAPFAAEVNLPGWVDEALLRGHLLQPHFDPEGLLTTLPALATTLAGVLAGHWLRAQTRPALRVAGLLAAGGFGLVLGFLLAPWCPLNKNLWTSTFVLFTSGAALCGLALCHWSIDVCRWQRWALPFVVYGTNPIVAYVLSSLIAKEMLLWRVTGPQGSVDLQHLVFDSIFRPWASTSLASLLYASAYVLLWLAVAAFLYRRRVLIKI